MHSPLFYFVSQRSNIGNGDFYDVAGMDELRRIEAYAYAGRRARSDDVAGQEGRSLREGLDELGNGEDKFACRRVLSHLAIDLGDDRKGIGRGVPQEQEGPHRAERIQALAVEPLAVISLEVAGRHVV